MKLIKLKKDQTVCTEMERKRERKREKTEIDIGIDVHSHVCVLEGYSNVCVWRL